MAINVDFWQSFAKKRNSTKQPDPAVKVRIECLLKADTSKEAPVFILKDDPNQDPSRFNYCSAFGYYYYIESREYVPPHWHMVCSMDYMASYKLQIGNTRAYITRANSEGARDDRLIDQLPTKTGPAGNYVSLGDPFVNTSPSYVVTLAGSTSSTGCTHYVFDPNEYKAFVQAFLDVGSWNLTDFADNYEKSQIKPLDYIKDVRWYPFKPASTSVNPESIYILGWDTGAVGSVMAEGTLFPIHMTQPVPKHPQDVEVGEFLNSGPYTKHTLVDPYFGMIEIDGSMTCIADTLDYSAVVDPSCGFAHLRLKALSQSMEYVIAERDAEMGVPVMFSVMTRDVEGLVSNFAGALTNTYTLNLGGLIGNISGIASAALYPKIQTTGSIASKAMYQYEPTLYTEFLRVSPIDPVTMGYPICKTAYIGSFYGFVMVAKGDVEIAGTSEARAVIKSYLEGGFYYE